jgi:hypothetical protein
LRCKQVGAFDIWTYLAVFVVPGCMRLSFFSLDFEAGALLMPGSEVVTPSKGLVFELGIVVLVFEDDDDVEDKVLLLIAVH